MTTVSYTQTRQNLKSIFDQVINNSEPVVVQRRNGENLVIISETDYRALNETAYLKATQANEQQINKSLDDFEKSNYQEISFEDL